MADQNGNPMNKNKDVEMSQSPPLQSFAISGSNRLVIPPVPHSGGNSNDNSGYKQRHQNGKSKSAQKSRNVRRNNGILAEAEYKQAFLSSDDENRELDEDEIKSKFEGGVKDIQKAFGGLLRHFEDTQTTRRRLRTQMATIATLEDLKKRTNAQTKHLIEELQQHKTRIKTLKAENEHKRVLLRQLQAAKAPPPQLPNELSAFSIVLPAMSSLHASSVRPACVLAATDCSLCYPGTHRYNELKQSNLSLQEVNRMVQTDADAMVGKLAVVLQEIIGVYTDVLGAQHVDLSGASIDRMETIKENLANQYLASKEENNRQSPNGGDLDL